MKNYEKPIILANYELSEGVFAASGAPVTSSGGDVVASMTRCDTYGNYYFKMTGTQEGATYRIVITVNETETVNGLSSASRGTIVGNTITWDDTLYSNMTDFQIYLCFTSQGNWENGWQLSQSDMPTISISATKIS